MPPFSYPGASKYGYGYEILIMKTWHVILILILCLLCFLAGRHTNRIGDELVGKTDTSTLHDTIRDSIPYPVYETVIQTVPELFPVYITLGGDTIREPVYIPVPITQKEYGQKITGCPYPVTNPILITSRSIEKRNRLQRL